MPGTVTNKVLVAPLNWGLGHATRCIPIIRELQLHGYTPVLASDGQALQLLQKEFPLLTVLELPSYNIVYPAKGKQMKRKLLLQIPGIISVMRREKKLVAQWVDEFHFCGIISDNRFGVYSNKVPSVFVTHQLRVLSGSTTWLTTLVHRLIMRKFKQWWVPDAEGPYSLSGQLGHVDFGYNKIKYIGALSRFQVKKVPTTVDLLVLLSGPEPQRTIAEEILIKEIAKYKGTVVFVKGVVEDVQVIKQEGHVLFYNYMTTASLEDVLNQCKQVVCRSGYSTIMDLSVLGKKAFFIPTPGQYEQVFLAQKMKKDGFAPFCKQERFTIGNLLETGFYRGIPNLPRTKILWEELFGLFKCE